MNGLELAAVIRQRSPDTAIVLISAYFYQEDSIVTVGLEENLFIGFVAKPFDLQEVLLIASRAVGRTKEENHAAD
jgi:CheY-like chemotaxis protein